MGRKIRTLVPILESQLQPGEIPNNVIRDAHEKSKMSSKAYYDQHHVAKTPLQNLSPGDQVALKSDQTSKWSVPGTVAAADQSNRTYLVNTPSGVFRRHRQQLLKAISASPTSTAENVLPESSDEQDNNENILAPNNPSNVINSPPLPFLSSLQRPNTRLRRGFVAAKPARFREEE